MIGAENLLDFFDVACEEGRSRLYVKKEAHGTLLDASSDKCRLFRDCISFGGGFLTQ
jgi:hypothetical protein